MRAESTSEAPIIRGPNAAKQSARSEPVTVHSTTPAAIGTSAAKNGSGARREAAGAVGSTIGRESIPPVDRIAILG
ncbi:hypothetical protein GCM10010213_13960 [Microbacterium maritypicum]|uniref:Uncharacterized protein n=1 Tax=Microbacterium maritypicum TaxID=33918 RepID=A0A4Y4B8A1_MICMQ|nr:hypothetical protein MLI01_13890 [Microbacterium liquefaciens]GGV55022.1 hypothetical protein GCM10010213_13960 [Microbacterium liquefaciens]